MAKCAYDEMIIIKWYDETLEGLSKSVKKTKWPCALAYDEKNNEIMKWWNEQWNDETLEGLSNSVKHTKCPSELAYDEMNIHVKRFE